MLDQGRQRLQSASGQTNQRAINGRLKGSGDPQATASGRDGAASYGRAAEIFDGGEREGFLREAQQAKRAVRTLCMTLAYAGCRLSETSALTADPVDLGAGVLVFESLKKCRLGVYRSVPVPLPC